MREARRPAARAHAHEAFRRFLPADVARLALRVLLTRLRRDRYGLLKIYIFGIGVILLGAAAFSDLPTELVVAALLPVLFLAGRRAVERLAAAALLRRVWERGSAAGAVYEEHLSLWAAPMRLCGWG